MTVDDPRDVLDAFRLALRSLEIASERIQRTYALDDIDAAAVEAHFGLHAAYDLLEVYFTRVRSVRAIAMQDDVLAQAEGETLGALAFARGEHTHRLITFASHGGWPGTPQGMGPFGRGWLWAPSSRVPEEKLARRGKWYSTRVARRMLHTPIDNVSRWGTERYWEYVAAHGLEQFAHERRERAEMHSI